MTRSDPVIDSARLRRLLDGVNAFGFNKGTGGFNRVGYSDADIAVRDWFASQMQASGLAVTHDAVGNVFGRLGPQDGPCIMTGSHLDTVPEGGAFDGALGACVALECLRAVSEAGITPATALVAVATAEEEGRFGGMLGSQTIAGAATPEWIDQASDSDGVRLVDAMAAQGLDAYGALDAAWPPGSIRAFLELHIEQGPVLERTGRSVGVAHGISGVCFLQVRLTGTANHSGTTPMEMRADAFAALAAFAVAIPQIIAATGTDQSRITVGKVELKPNFAHTIPGEAEFSVIIRDTSEPVMRALRQAVTDRIGAVAAVHGVGHDITEKSWLAPVTLDPEIHALFMDEARALGINPVDMPSGAGHDAQTMQGTCPSGLIFVPSRGGISHAPAEWTDWHDIETGAQLMLNTLVRLASG